MNHLRAYRPLPLVAAAFLFTAVPSLAQTPAPDPVPVAAPLPAQIELNLINLPTTMSIARHKGYFRLTHRFASDLRRGSFSQNAADLFTLDKGAIIGLEYRYAITGNIQAGVHRSLLSKTIQTFGRWDALRQGDSFPLSASLTLSYEGLNNLRQLYQPGVAVRNTKPASRSPSRARSATGWRCMRHPRSWPARTPWTSSPDMRITTTSGS